MAVFEASYKEDMTQQEAEALVARAIKSGALVVNPKTRSHLLYAPLHDPSRSLLLLRDSGRMHTVRSRYGMEAQAYMTVNAVWQSC